MPVMSVTRSRPLIPRQSSKKAWARRRCQCLERREGRTPTAGPTRGHNDVMEPWFFVPISVLRSTPFTQGALSVSGPAFS